MVFGNPFYEEVRAAVNSEAHDLRDRKDELVDETELSEAELEAAVSETVKRIRSGMYHHEQSDEDLLSVWGSLTHLASEWGRYDSRGIGGTDREALEALLWGTAQMTAYDEAEKVEYVLRELYF